MSEEAYMPLTYAQLRAMSDQDVVRAYDYARHHSQPGINLIHQELVFRENDKQTREMVNLTRTMTRLTWCIFVLTHTNNLIVGVAWVLK